MEKDPKNLDQHEPGAKLDAGKPRMELLQDFGLSFKEMAKVATFGAEKYSDGGWQHVENGVQRYTGAMQRHYIEERYESHDKESGQLHIAQTAWNAMARLELYLRKMNPSVMYGFSTTVGHIDSEPTAEAPPIDDSAIEKVARKLCELHFDGMTNTPQPPAVIEKHWPDYKEKAMDIINLL